MNPTPPTPFDAFDGLLRYLDGGSDLCLPSEPSDLGVAPGSPEWHEELATVPFFSFRIHPLPPRVQAFIDAHPDLTPAEWDALAESLDRSLALPPGFLIVPVDGAFDVCLRPS